MGAGGGRGGTSSGQLVQHIPRDLFDIKVICLTRKGVWAREIEERGIEVVSMGKKVGFDPWILPKLVAFLRREKPDLVNTHLWTADLWARLAAVIAGVPRIVVTEQNVDIWKRWYHKAIDRILFTWTDHLICVSEQVVEFYTTGFGVPKEKTAMIPNAIELASFDGGRPLKGLREEFGCAADEFLFVCAARLHPQKGHHDLMEAVRLLVAGGHRGFQLLVVGEGPLRTELERLRDAKGLKDWVRFLASDRISRRFFSSRTRSFCPRSTRDYPLLYWKPWPRDCPSLPHALVGSHRW